MKYRYGSPGLLTYDKWIILLKTMALGWNHVSSNYRVFQQNILKADGQEKVMLVSNRPEADINAKRFGVWCSDLSGVIPSGNT